MSGNEQIISLEQLAGLTPEQVLQLIDTGWPWPLDAVQDWFENLYNAIQSWFYSVAGWVYDRVKPLVDAVWAWIKTWSQWLYDSISPLFTQVWSWLQGIIAPIVAAIPSALQVVWDWINTAIGQVPGWLDAGILRVWDWLSSGFDALTILVTTGLTNISQSLAAFSTSVLLKVGEINSWFSNEFIDPFIDWLLQFPGKMAEALRNFFVDQWQLIWGFWSRDWNWLKLLVGMVAAFTGGAILAGAPAIGAALLAALRWLGGSLLARTAALGTFFTSLLPRIAGWFAANWVPILGSSAILGLEATGQLNAIIDRFVTPAITGVFDWAESIGPVAPQSGKDMSLGITKLAEFTVSGLAAMTLAGEALSPLKHIGLGHVAAIVYDLINYKTLTAAFMGVLAYVYIKQPLTYYYNKTARPEIPSSRDLISLVGEYAIDRKTFTDYMQFHGYPDIWIDRLWELADRPFTPRLLTQLAMAGVVDDNLIDRELHNAGYNELSIPYLKTWLRREASGEAKTLMSGMAVSRYREGLDNETVLRQNLDALGVADTIMDKYVFGAQLGEVLDYQKDLVAFYIDAYHRRDIEEPELRRSLISAGVRPDRLDLKVEAQKIKRLAAPKPVEDPAIAVQFDTIRDRRKKNLISRDEEIRQLILLGKTLGYATALADNDDAALAEKVPPVPVPPKPTYLTDVGKVEVDTIRWQRRKNLITAQVELTQLIALAMPQALARATVEEDDVLIAEKRIVKPPLAKPMYQTEIGKVQVDNVRTLRLQAALTDADEYNSLISLEMSPELAQAVVDNDTLELEKKRRVVVTPQLPYYETEAGKVKVDTIRRQRRARLISAADEMQALQQLDMPDDYAKAIVDNDELRLRKETLTEG